MSAAARSAILDIARILAPDGCGDMVARNFTDHDLPDLVEAVRARVAPVGNVAAGAMTDLATVTADPRPGDVVRLHRPGMEPGKIDTAIVTVLRADHSFVGCALAYIGGPVFERDLEIDDWRKLMAAGVDVYEAHNPPHVVTVIYLSDRADSARRAMTGGEAP